MSFKYIYIYYMALCNALFWLEILRWVIISHNNAGSTGYGKPFYLLFLLRILNNSIFTS